MPYNSSLKIISFLLTPGLYSKLELPSPKGDLKEVCNKVIGSIYYETPRILLVTCIQAEVKKLFEPQLLALSPR